MLLSLIPLLLGFDLIFLSLQFGFFGQVLKPVSLLQLLLLGCHLLLGRNQLPFNLIGQLPLALGLCLSTLQGRISALPLLFLSLQLLLEISIAIFSNG